MNRNRTIIFLTAISVMMLIATVLYSQVHRTMAQTVYVPAYSHIYFGNREKPYLLSCTLSIRNTDMNSQIRITSIDYHDTDGRLVYHMIKKPVTVGPLGTVRYVISESDTKGGSGAKFIVKWDSAGMVNEPLIESVMISTRGGQGISFTSRGKVIKEGL